MEYATVGEAMERPGVRLVLTAGVPGHWGESIKALVDYKGLDYLPVAQEGGGENAELLAWTGQSSAPVLVCDDLPPACHWLDQLMLLERLQPHPALLPTAPEARADAIGLCALIAGAEGFGWWRRMAMIQPMMGMDPVPPMAQRMAHKYAYSDAACASAPGHMRDICAALQRRLADSGGDYFCGDQPTAVDFYWACFAGMIKPLSPELNPMADWMRSLYTADEPEIRACLTPLLENHRDMMYQRHITTPLDF